MEHVGKTVRLTDPQILWCQFASIESLAELRNGRELGECDRDPRELTGSALVPGQDDARCANRLTSESSRRNSKPRGTWAAAPLRVRDTSNRALPILVDAAIRDTGSGTSSGSSDTPRPQAMSLHPVITPVRAVHLPHPA